MGYRTDAIGRLDHPTLAARHWVVSLDELRTAGLTARQVRERAAAGVLHRLYRGVYVVGRRELSFEGSCRAAWLAGGPGSAISHGTAARVWRIRRWFGRAHVCVPRGRAGHPGLVVHRPRSLGPADIVARDGFAVTSVARTLLDLSPGRPVEEIGRWIQEAVVQRVFDQREVLAVLGRHPGHRGGARLEAALALEVAPTKSGLEDAFLDLCGRAYLPRPVVNAHLWSADGLEEVDFHWPSARVVVETDGARFHATRWRRRRDAAKDERLRAAGWTVLRVPELAVTLDPDGVAARLAATLGRSNRRIASLR